MEAHYLERYLILSGIGPRLKDCAYPNPTQLRRKVLISLIYEILESCQYIMALCFQGYTGHIDGGTYSFSYIFFDELDGVVSVLSLAIVLLLL